jgi:DNA-binding XRE family transcriptional regulator
MLNGLQKLVKKGDVDNRLKELILLAENLKTSKEIFAFNLKRIRKEANIRQDEMAIKLNKHRNTIYRWETGETTPSWDELDDICKYLKCSPLDLLGGEEQQKAKEILESLASFIKQSSNKKDCFK